MLRRKCTGVCSLASAEVMGTMAAVPEMDARCAGRRRRTRAFPRCWAAGKPSKVNSWTLLSFFISRGFYPTQYHHLLLLI